MRTLDQDQFARLADALGSAFDDFTLNVLVTKRIEKRGLPHYVTRFAPFEYQATMLAQRAESDGFTDRLILAARESRPRNETFSALAHELGLTALGPVTEDATRLEALVRKTNRFHDFALWRMALTEIESRVCSIEIRGEQGGPAVAYGSGTLVGADRVLTNAHVLAPLFRKGGDGLRARPESVVVRFDYKRLRNKDIYAGDEFTLAGDWEIDRSPVDELDYALIRLSQKAGEKPAAGWTGIADAPARGWIELKATDDPFARDTPLLIAQHPDHEPLQFAFDTQSMIGLTDGGTRVRHRTNTRPGSSGAPYFNQFLELIGIHRAGDNREEPEFNVGVPINPIVERIAAKVSVQ